MAGLDVAYTVALWPLRTRNFQAHAAKLQTLVEAVAATARPIRGRSRHLQHYPAPDIHPGPFDTMAVAGSHNVAYDAGVASVLWIEEPEPSSQRWVSRQINGRNADEDRGVS